MDTTLLATIGIVMAAGFVRGVTGFGGAMLMSPILSVLIGPVPTVVTALVLETAAALVMFPDAWPKARWRTLMYLTLPAIFTVPLGVRYRGSPRPATSIALGGLVGALLGATSVGAPPVILYLLSGPDPVSVTRANLTLFVTAISVIGLVMLAAAGAITPATGVSALALTAPYLLATWLGGKLFLRLSETGVRRLALVLMLGVSIASLVM